MEMCNRKYKVTSIRVVKKYSSSLLLDYRTRVLAAALFTSPVSGQLRERRRVRGQVETTQDLHSDPLPPHSSVTCADGWTCGSTTGLFSRSRSHHITRRRLSPSSSSSASSSSSSCSWKVKRPTGKRCRLSTCSLAYSLTCFRHLCQHK